MLAKPTISTTAVTATTFTLTWSAVAGATAYRLYELNSSYVNHMGTASYGQLIATITAPTVTYTKTGLTADKFTAYYRVVAIANNTSLTAFSYTATTLSTQKNAYYNNVTQSATSGAGTGAIFNIGRNGDGEIKFISIDNGGSGYAIGDTVTIAGTSVGGASPADNITLTVANIRGIGEGIPSDSVRVHFRGLDTLAPQELPVNDGEFARTLLYGYDTATNKFRPIQMDPTTGELKTTT